MKKKMSLKCNRKVSCCDRFVVWCRRHPLISVMVGACICIAAVQLLYSFHSWVFLEAKFDAGSLLQFLGIVLGFAFVALTNQKNEVDRRVERILSLEPRLNITLMRLGNDKCEVCISNDTNYFYYNLRISSIYQFGNLYPMAKISRELSIAEIQKMAQEEKERRRTLGQRKDELAWEVFLTVVLTDSEAGVWYLSFFSDEALSANFEETVLIRTAASRIPPHDYS